MIYGPVMSTFPRDRLMTTVRNEEKVKDLQLALTSTRFSTIYIVAVITSLFSMAACISNTTTISTMTSTSVAAATFIPLAASFLIPIIWALIWTLLDSRNCYPQLFIESLYWLFCLFQNSS